MITRAQHASFPSDERTWDDQFQTGLRLKLNTWIVGTVPSPDEPSVSLASRRGLVVAHHHFNLLGARCIAVWGQPVHASR